jgi:hypothetical protein
MRRLVGILDAVSDIGFNISAHKRAAPSERGNKPMAKKPSNSGKPWTGAQTSQLNTLAQGNTPTRVIGIKMGRTPAAISQKASQEGISLKPTNQSPYGTKKSK